MTSMPKSKCFGHFVLHAIYYPNTTFSKLGIVDPRKPLSEMKRKLVSHLTSGQERAFCEWTFSGETDSVNKLLFVETSDVKHFSIRGRRSTDQ